ncbi:enoyl-CoA hydratase-related protein [Aquabacterium sp.]|uniref:enoyl-CoA hydratase-related protein n=1 Tax=Aquabacterium sp. TaxID=1872578 RepID=UPI003784188A
MRVLLLAHSFNSLTQRLFVELRERGHEVFVELDIADSVTEEAVALARPDVLVAPFLKRRIPAAVWQRLPCLVVHPGPAGDRGPAALDWALLEGRTRWGVTVLQADGEYDAGPVWAEQAFEIAPGATKSAVYRHALADAALRAVLQALQAIERDEKPRQVVPEPLRGPVPADQRRIDWSRDDAATVLCRVRSADGAPGAKAWLAGRALRLFDVHPATPHAQDADTPPGQWMARRGPAVRVRCADGAVWIGAVREDEGDGAAPTAGLKLPPTMALPEAAALPEWPQSLWTDEGTAPLDWDELRYEEFGPPGARVGWLAFDVHNGALGERASARLLAAWREACSRDTQVLVLAGGADQFCNGIHLHEIEAAARRANDSAADASMRSIEAIDDLALALIDTTDRLVVSTLRGNAGAGGCFLALAADEVWSLPGVVLNPHYRNMGNLHGSEYWTFLLPRRIGLDASASLMRGRLPMGAAEALRRGLVDAVLADEAALRAQAAALAADAALPQRIAAKAARRAADEARRPLAEYRADELAAMRRNFYGFDPSYHVARHHFVHRKPHAWTPRHLATHRR